PTVLLRRQTGRQAGMGRACCSGCRGRGRLLLLSRGHLSPLLPVPRALCSPQPVLKRGPAVVQCSTPHGAVKRSHTHTTHTHTHTLSLSHTHTHSHTHIHTHTHTHTHCKS